jgi:hypothetical protein
MPAAFVAAAVTLYLPYLSVGKKVTGFLSGYADEELGEENGLYILAILKQLGLGAAALPLFLGAGGLTLLALAWRAGFRPCPSKPDPQGLLHGALHAPLRLVLPLARSIPVLLSAAVSVLAYAFGAASLPHRLAPDRRGIQHSIRAVCSFAGGGKS